MAHNRSIDANRGKVKDIDGNFKSKEKQLQELEQNKEAFREERRALENSNIDDRVKRDLAELTNEAWRENSEKAKELSRQMDGDFKMLDELMEESELAIADIDKSISKVEATGRLLDVLGLGKSLDGAIQELDESREEEQELIAMIRDVMKDGANISSDLNRV